MLVRSVVLVFTLQDFVDVATLPSSSHLNPNRPSMAALRRSTERAAATKNTIETATHMATAAASDADAPRKKTASFGNYADGVPPAPTSNTTGAPAVQVTADTGGAPKKKGVSFASQEESSGLPDGWTAHEDPASKKTYYLSAANGKTTWEKPSALPASATEI